MIRVHPYQNIFSVEERQEVETILDDTARANFSFGVPTIGLHPRGEGVFWMFAYFPSFSIIGFEMIVSIQNETFEISEENFIGYLCQRWDASTDQKERIQLEVHRISKIIKNARNYYIRREAGKVHSLQTD